MMPEKEMPVDDALSFFAAFAADVAEEEQYLSLAASER
jgi:hypothetical protein